MYIEFACLDNVRAQLKQIVCVRLEIMPLMCGDYRFSLLTVERLFILAKAYVKKKEISTWSANQICYKNEQTMHTL